MPCSHQTPVRPERQAFRRPRCCLPPLTRRRLSREVAFGAQSHGLHPRCLRFATPVTRTPRKTRFRAVATLTRAGLDPQGLLGRFPSDSSHVISSPFPELRSAHARPNENVIVGACRPCEDEPRLRREEGCLRGRPSEGVESRLRWAQRGRWPQPKGDPDRPGQRPRSCSAVSSWRLAPPPTHLGRTAGRVVGPPNTLHSPVPS